ncbi:hypothetical protein LZ016_10485 [Sphingomonas sp. SM33]|uniref:Toxin co-regulated pilus biosynthesis protein Q C-terminal domain-containing protein n=1 Tax=Sphingomonas telluris TaxID=2907998 RepID=A0ABS9VNH1_9SPHN|nr:hypothetical protein [Sphingomonas telluris]MCH8616525.1 hypothetical protein [Sphingomonas telluris]
MERQNSGMNFRATMGAALLVMLTLGCTTKTASASDDPTTGLTLSGSSSSISAFLAAAKGRPEKWTVEKRWSKSDGTQAVRLQWPNRPGPSDVGSIVALVQAAQANGLVISDTQIVETQP